VVNARLISSGVSIHIASFRALLARVLIGTQVRDYAGLVDQASQALRPNGLVNFTEFDFHVYGEDKMPIVVDVHEFAPPYFPRWLCIVRAAVEQRGGETGAANHLHRWVSEHPSFTDVVYRSFLFPASPWIPSDYPNADRMNRTGAFMRDDILVRCSLLWRILHT